MMSVKEYAIDTNHSVAEILKKCSELGINVKNADDDLSEDDIIILDNTINLISTDVETDYEDEDALNRMRQNYPAYADNVATWSEQSSGMMQFAMWTALEDMGYGASLQHYNPLIDKAVAERWLINPDWRLIAQMPFGAPLDSPAHRTSTKTLNERRIIYSDTEII